MGDKMTVGEKIKRYRQEKGLSQKALGELCIPKMGASHIGRIENDETSPTAKTLQRIATALGVKVADLTNDRLQVFYEKSEEDVINELIRQGVPFDPVLINTDSSNAAIYYGIFSHLNITADYNADTHCWTLRNADGKISNPINGTTLDELFQRIFEHLEIEFNALI